MRLEDGFPTFHVDRLWLVRGSHVTVQFSVEAQMKEGKAFINNWDHTKRLESPAKFCW